MIIYRYIKEEKGKFVMMNNSDEKWKIGRKIKII